MANNCFYQMRVVGDKRENLEKFFRAMNWEGEYKESGVGRVYDCDMLDDIELRADGLYEMTLAGDCAWSVQCAMIKGVTRDFPNGLPAQSERLNLDIEVYSEECGLEFQEHHLFKKGEHLISDCVDWYDIDLEGHEDDVEYVNELIDDYKIAEHIKTGNYKDYVEDGYLRVGGFEWKYSI